MTITTIFSVALPAVWSRHKPLTDAEVVPRARGASRLARNIVLAVTASILLLVLLVGLAAALTNPPEVIGADFAPEQGH